MSSESIPAQDITLVVFFSSQKPTTAITINTSLRCIRKPGDLFKQYFIR